MHCLFKMAPANLDSFLNETKMNKNLCRKYLLEWPSRVEYTNGSVLLLKSMMRLTHYHSDFALTTDPEKVCEDHFSTARAAFNSSKKIVTLTSYVHCILGMAQGEGQVYEAGRILATNNELLYQPLRTELEAIVKGAPTAAPKQKVLKKGFPIPPFKKRKGAPGDVD